MTAILIATIGTRDLMFQISSGEWFNIGDDRMQNGDIIGEQAEVISDLGFSKISYRDLTKYIFDAGDRYLDRIKPVIIGKILVEQADRIEALYLVGTDQKTEVSQRDKDTIHTCRLIEAWVRKTYDIPKIEVVSIGTDGTNPSNFEAMFEWWRNAWRKEIALPINREIWLALKGGVGQASEAGRISGLSLHGERINFFEFHQNERHNRAGNPSAYTGPFLGTNYLWDRTQQQALGLLDRFDYAGAESSLNPYLQSRNLGAISNLLRAGIAWNRGEFDSFLRYVNATNILDRSQQYQSQTWWWMAYEQAYLAAIRLQQNSTTEAMLHGFRSVEGCLLEWIKATFPDDFSDNSQGFPIVYDSILQAHPNLRNDYNKARGNYQHAQWRGSLRQRILEIVIPEAARHIGFQCFWSDECQGERNAAAHLLGGISERDLFGAWGEDINNRSQWEQRILGCINILTRQSFKTLDRASLFAKVHDRVRQSILTA
jgi:hypothetical protein